LALKNIYIPEVILAYISIVQAAAYFMNRELATKAMDIATTIADADRRWLQDVFLETGRMSELVDELALVSMAMLKLGEGETKGSRTKKRGNRGESVRIWDLNVRN
jgi:nuclear pore complex protein Nup107